MRNKRKTASIQVFVASEVDKEVWFDDLQIKHKVHCAVIGVRKTPENFK